MTRLIRLTRDGEPLLLNPDRIAYVQSIPTPINDARSVISFSEADDDYIRVDQDIEQIAAAIRSP